MKITIQKNTQTKYWHVYIDDVDMLKAKRLLTIVKTLVKFIKGRPELDKEDK